MDGLKTSVNINPLLLGGILVLGDSVPGPAGMAGLALILAGMALNSLVTAQ